MTNARIFKKNVSLADSETVIPGFVLAAGITVQTPPQHVSIWFLEGENIDTRIKIVGTGEPWDVEKWIYKFTVVSQPDQFFVWHVLQEGRHGDD